LVPAVSASLKNAVSTLRPIEKPRLSATARTAARQKHSPNKLSHFKLKTAHPKQKKKRFYGVNVPAFRNIQFFALVGEKLN
jgi:hypothetical protein